jgi:23S rRNA (adenine2030-N6)-methyltransferase
MRPRLKVEFMLCPPTDNADDTRAARDFQPDQIDMNYRHAFHAGNFADVAKHLALVSILTHLKKKTQPFAVIDTHAGRGLYPIKEGAAARTGEAAGGIAKLDALHDAPGLVGQYLAAVRSFGDGLYPGSPLIAAKLLRPQDRLIAIEKHPEEAAALKHNLHQWRIAFAEDADGYSRLPALLPPKERRGVILIDPPFEADDEFAQAARAFTAAYRRFATGVYLLWFPVKLASAADAFGGEVLAAGAKKVLRIDVSIAPVSHNGKERLSTAGVIVVNPPFGMAEEMQSALGEVILHLGSDAESRQRWLAGPG